ncbi:MAG: tetratricopeptide repeat protein [Acidobacteria bacterium]|nr:tetratricopeptide repeat protein [Acidobacteriota bacterium]
MSPPNPIVDVLRRNLRQALHGNSLEEAEKILLHLRKEDPLSRETRGLELELLLKAHRLGEAQALAQQLCQLFPDSGRIQLLAGQVAYRQKRYSEALACFHESQRIYPHWQTQQWLGKTLTQLGLFDQAESLLLAAREHSTQALLDLGWLYERQRDWSAAGKSYNAFLKEHPGHSFATNQLTRVKAKQLDPEALIEEAETLAEFGQALPEVLFEEYIDSLFATGQGPAAREALLARLPALDARQGVRLAWVCHRAQAYDLACRLFLSHLETNLNNFKYLAAFESSARKCHRLPDVLDAYRRLAPLERKLYGRMRSLANRMRKA